MAGFGAIQTDVLGAPHRWRDRAFDLMTATFPRHPISQQIVVVDIDRRSLGEIGPWPWPRDTLAHLVDIITAGGPSVIAFDMLLSAQSAGQGQENLAAAIGRGPAVLGMVLDPTGAAPDLEGPPILATGTIKAPDILTARGLGTPPAELRHAARGTGIISLAAPEGEPVRAVPLLALAGRGVYDGLAVEALRIAQGGPTLIVQATPVARLRIGPFAAPLGEAASLRLHQVGSADRARRTIPAASLWRDPASAMRLKGKVVFLGTSAPEAGGSLRATAADPFMPSVQIEADAAGQLADGSYLTRPRAIIAGEAALTLILGVAATAAAILFGPLAAVIVVLGLIALWMGAAAFAFVQRGWLVDPLLPSLFIGITFQGTALAGYAATRRERRAIESRFAQHLSPAVVRRIAENPEMLRLEGEERIVTALFTDIEGFTSLTDRSPSRQLVAMLNDYIDLVSSIVIQHGGMVDKIVGDAVHAFFNAPLDLEQHAQRAVACALAIIPATEALRQQPDPARWRFGRTRVGIETGTAVVGDFGGSRKLDYTAHGRAINAAAKLEAANKLFASSIAVGPGTAASCAGVVFRPLGIVELAPETGPILIREPWPVAGDDDLALYNRAFAAAKEDPIAAAALFQRVSARYPEDKVLGRWVERLRGAA
ncbi:MAG: CHASE2 domain-containing protein [Acetobacteraceae bacterium]